MTADLSPDPIFDHLGGESDVVALVGFLGAGPDGFVRLFQDPELKISMDIPAGEVVHRHRVGPDVDLLGGRSTIWVNGSRMRESIDEGIRDRLARAFLVGDFAAEYLTPESLEDAAEQLTFMAYYRPPKTGKRCP